MHGDFSSFLKTIRLNIVNVAGFILNTILNFEFLKKISENFPFRVCLFFSDVIKEREIQSQIIQFIARSGYGYAQLLISKASFICPILSMAY